MGRKRRPAERLHGAVMHRRTQDSYVGVMLDEVSEDDRRDVAGPADARTRSRPSPRPLGRRTRTSEWTVRAASTILRTMQTPRAQSRRRTIALLAMFAFAANALWPLIANLGPVGLPMLTQVCSTSGPGYWLDDRNPSPGGMTSLVPHCPFCSLGADQVGAPPSVGGCQRAEPTPSYIASPVRSSPPRALASRRSAQPRAPPSAA